MEAIAGGVWGVSSGRYVLSDPDDGGEELEPDGDDRTVVTHYHDWAEVTDPEILGRVREVSPDEMRMTIGNLAEALA